MAERHTLDHTVAADVAADTQNARCLPVVHCSGRRAYPLTVRHWQTEFAGGPSKTTEKCSAINRKSPWTSVRVAQAVCIKREGAQHSLPSSVVTIVVTAGS
jgi:hypothetical protein